MTENSRALFLAGDKAAKKIHEAQAKEFRKKIAEFTDGGIPLKSVFKAFVRKADQAREIGILLTELCETLPGGKLTRDFYEQEKELGFFNDGNGRPVDFELVQWFIKIAKENHEPILDFQTALKYKQPLMLASNDKALILQPSERRQKHCPPTDPLASFKKLADPSEWSESWKSLLSNADYCPDGHFRDTLRETLAEQLKPVFPVWIDIIANAQGWDDEKKHRVQIAMES